MTRFYEYIELTTESVAVENVNNTEPTEELSPTDTTSTSERVEEDHEDDPNDEEEEEEEEEEDWSEITVSGKVYYVNPQQTRWIRSDDLCPLLREYYPGMENDIDYDDLEPIKGE
jgi:hypothetical protein